MAAVLTRTLTEELTGKPRISYEEFLALDDERHFEWVGGEVVCMPSVGSLHQDVAGFLLELLRPFVRERALGRLFYDPFLVRLTRSGRAPDITVLLNEHLSRLRDNYIEGAADLAVEVVSPDGVRRDYVEKRAEYEAAGIPEYWIIDPEKQEATFFVLIEGRYVAAELEDGVFRSTVLSGFWLREQWLWERPLVRPLLREILGE